LRALPTSPWFNFVDIRQSLGSIARLFISSRRRRNEIRLRTIPHKTSAVLLARNVHREPFDFVGFLTLSLGIGALQLMLDRGELKDWFHSSEIWVEATVAGLGFYLFTVHWVTTDEARFSTAIC
jgi:hypothetical protein